MREPWGVVSHSSLFTKYFGEPNQRSRSLVAFETLAALVDPVARAEAIEVMVRKSIPDLGKLEFPLGYKLSVQGTTMSASYSEQGCRGTCRETYLDGEVHTSVPMQGRRYVSAHPMTYYGAIREEDFDGSRILVQRDEHNIISDIWSGMFKGNGSAGNPILERGLHLAYAPAAQIRWTIADTFEDGKPYGACSFWKEGHVYDSHCDGAAVPDTASKVSFV